MFKTTGHPSVRCQKPGTPVLGQSRVAAVARKLGLAAGLRLKPRHSIAGCSHLQQGLNCDANACPKARSSSRQNQQCYLLGGNLNWQSTVGLRLPILMVLPRLLNSILLYSLKFWCRLTQSECTQLWYTDVT